MDRTWIVVCDASRCRFFMKRTGTHEWVKFEEFDHPAGRAKGIDLVSDRPGRSMESESPGTRAGTEPRLSPHQVEVKRFARYISDTLENAYHQNAFEKLVLVAPPNFLGELKGTLPDKLHRAIYATLDKDYSQLDQRDIENRIDLP